MTSGRPAFPGAPAWPNLRAFYFARELRDVLFLVAHVPFGLLAGALPLLAQLQAIGTVLLGIVWSLDARTAHRTVYAAAYVAGAEVFWRMTDSTPVYEYGKYAVALLVVLASFRLPGRRMVDPLPIFYIVLLVPSAFLTVSALGPGEEARQQISFNLSGPFALAAAAFLFRRLSNNDILPRMVLLALAAPTIAALSRAGRSTLTAQEIRFTTESNFVTSGGFGPNQVSAALGLGALLLILLAFNTKTGLWRVAFLGIASALLVQAILTFSRGGVFNAIVGIGLLAAHYVRQKRTRVVVIATLGCLGLLGTQFVLPALDRFTGGVLVQRYGDVDPGLRKSMAEREIEIWLDNPVLGVGPGMAKGNRETRFGISVAAHTEYTRLLAEHGTFGLAALLILAWMIAAAYLRAPTDLTRAWVAVLGSWTMLEMFHAAMRIAAISFVFGATLLDWRSPGETRPATGSR